MTTEQIHTRAKASLRSLFTGDALSMPVHWYYNPMDILREFPGGVRKMHPAPAYHPSSIMSLHSTSAGGRGSQSSGSEREIVGDVILRDKRQFWGIANQHYHQGMPAGENTLNAWCARVLIRGLASRGDYNSSDFLTDYVDFMTADPAQHPDTYAESYHRGFFANLESGKAIEKCGAVTHDTPSIGGLVTVVPLAIFQLVRGNDLENVQAVCRKHLSLTHPDETLGRVCDAMIQLIHDLLYRDEQDDPLPYLLKASKCLPKINLESLLKKAPGDLQVIGGHYSSACYITDSWPCMLYLAIKYSHNVEEALIANTNAGGENAHRGSVLGSVVGLITGEAGSELYGQLLHRSEIDSEIDRLLR